jgi:hypothetical protein
MRGSTLSTRQGIPSGSIGAQKWDSMAQKWVLKPQTMKATLEIPNVSFDRVMALARPGDTVTLEPGAVYETAGAWAFADRGFLTIPPGVTLIATGATIRLKDAFKSTGGVERPDRDLPIAWAGDGARIIGGTWDANWQDFPGWFTQGIRFFGRFSITGLRGSRESGTPAGQVESFAISAQGDTGGSEVVRVTVANCKTDSPQDYVSGIFMGQTGASSEEWSRVEACNVDLGAFGQFAYSNNGRTKFLNCIGKASRGWYNDTGSTDIAELVSCRLEGAWAAIASVWTDASHRNVVAIDCDLTGERAVEWDDRAGVPLPGSMTVVDSRLSCRYSAAINGKAGSCGFVRTPFGDAQAAVSQGSFVPFSTV